MPSFLICKTTRIWRNLRFYSLSLELDGVQPRPLLRKKLARTEPTAESYIFPKKKKKGQSGSFPVYKQARVSMDCIPNRNVSALFIVSDITGLDIRVFVFFFFKEGGP